MYEHIQKIIAIPAGRLCRFIKLIATVPTKLHIMHVLCKTQKVKPTEEKHETNIIYTVMYVLVLLCNFSVKLTKKIST